MTLDRAARYADPALIAAHAERERQIERSFHVTGLEAPERRAEMVERCVDCKDGDRCMSWADGRGGAVELPPDCPHAGWIERLAPR